MKFNVDSRELAKAIGPVKEVATKNCVKEFDYCGFLTIKAKKHKLEIMAYGGTASITTTISNAGTANYKCKREGVVTVYATDIFDALETMDAGTVDIKAVSGELVITLVSNKSIKRSIEVVDAVVRPPNVGTKFVQSVVVNKRIFVKALKSVMFAPATEEKMLPYQCMLIETFTKGKDNTIRFSAGSGGRFAIKAISGKHIYETDEDVQIIFPKYNLSNIYKVLSSVRCDSVLVRTVGQNSSKNIPEQIMIELDAGDVEIVLSIFGSESFTKYPNLTNIINYQYPNRIYSDLKVLTHDIGKEKL